MGSIGAVNDGMSSIHQNEWGEIGIEGALLGEVFHLRLRFHISSVELEHILYSIVVVVCPKAVATDVQLHRFFILADQMD